jgi:hypothetical protein
MKLEWTFENESEMIDRCEFTTPHYKQYRREFGLKHFELWKAILESHGAKVNKLTQVVQVIIEDQQIMWWPETGTWMSKQTRGKWFYKLNEFVASLKPDTTNKHWEQLTADVLENVGFRATLKDNKLVVSRGIVKYEVNRSGHWICCGNSLLIGNSISSLIEELERVKR